MFPRQVVLVEDFRDPRCLYVRLLLDLVDDVPECIVRDMREDGMRDIVQEGRALLGCVVRCEGVQEQHCAEGVLEAGDGGEDFVDVDEGRDAVLVDAVQALEGGVAGQGEEDGGGDCHGAVEGVGYGHG